MEVLDAYPVELIPTPFPPIFTIQSALNLYSEYLNNQSGQLKEHLLEYADSLVKGLVLKENFGVWPYYYLLGRARTYGCRIPWVSALAQGQGISVLLRAFGLHEDEEYLETARHALGAFGVPVSEGGVLYIDDEDGDWWYEEYACTRAEPSGVLNGFVLALIGIHEYHRFVQDDFSRRLFDQGIRTLRHHLSDFDTNCPYKLSYYDRQKHVVSIRYHSFHIKLMEILYGITKEPVFKKHYERWAWYREEFFKRRMYRWLSKIYYMKPGYRIVDSLRLAMAELRRKCARI